MGRGAQKEKILANVGKGIKGKVSRTNLLYLSTCPEGAKKEKIQYLFQGLPCTKHCP